MPSTYAHYRLGQEVRSRLREAEKKTVEAYPELFLIGLHGPDILFYYKPLFSNKVNRVGYAMHDKAGRYFVEKAVKVVGQNSGNEAFLSYVYGFLCHFALDETCHGYIDEKIAASGISHTEIEVEFDRMLMVKDGHDPIRHRLTDHIVPSEKNARIIQAFFQGVGSARIQKALESMIAYNNLLLAPSKGKRSLIHLLLRVTGNYKEMHGLLVNYRKNEQCDDSNKRLWDMYQEAEQLALMLIHEWRPCFEGKEKWNPVYDYTFGSKLKKEMESQDAV